jgi:AAA+ ATPase superfamily predicted ATPase
MVSQKEAVEGYIKMQADYESLNKLIDFRFEEIKNGIESINKSVGEHLIRCEKCKIDHGERIKKLEDFKNKVIYFYTAISVMVGVLVGWKLL